MTSMLFKEEIRHDYPLNKDSIIFDIGGYKGEWSEIMFNKYGSKIYCFEPVFKITNPNINIYPVGVGGHNRVESILVDRDKTGLFCNSGDQVNIVITDIMDIIKTHGIDHIDLMKINIEGMEYELLNRLCDTGWIRNIKDIQVQFHNISVISDRQMWEVQTKLKETHYPTYQFRYVWENWRRNENL